MPKEFDRLRKKKGARIRTLKNGRLIVFAGKKSAIGEKRKKLVSSIAKAASKKGRS
jgi:hypothetical protein